MNTRAASGRPATDAGAAFAPASTFDLRAAGLAKSYGATQIFDNVSFEIARAEAVAVVGANGTGKSTLLRCAMGLVPVNAGTVNVLGQDVTTARGRELRTLRSQIGLVSQKHNLVQRLSVLSNVVHGLLGVHPGVRHWSQTFAPQASRDAAMEALDRVGLAQLATRRADRLSGGQSQRVAIARALVSRPKIVIADEPCASLDPAAGEVVMELFFRLAREEQVTVIFTSHNITHALQYGDRVLGLANGGLRLDAPSGELAEADLRGLYD